MVRKKQVSDALAAYLRSDGTQFTVNTSQYIYGQVFENYCVFCHGFHDGRPVFKYEYRNLRTRINGVNACDFCDERIDEMLYYEHPEIYAEKTRTEQAFQDKVNDLVEDYKENYRFPENIDRYFIHIDYVRDSHAAYPPNMCPFCWKPITDESQGVMIDVPITHDSHLTGGKVLVCKEHGIENIPNETKHMCIRCKRHYPVAEDEVQYRATIQTVGNHLCPECAYKQVNEIDAAHPLLFIEENEPPRTEPPTRLFWKNCSFCAEAFIIDLTLPDKLSSKIHVIGGQLRCVNCFKMNMGESTDNSYVVLFDKNTYIYYRRQGAYWTYQVYSKLAGKPTQIYEDTALKSTVLTHCIQRAHAKVAELRKSNQRGLWDLD